MRVGVGDEEDFALERCPPITADVRDGGVQWTSGGDLAGVVGRQVRLVFELEDAKLYAFRFGESGL